MASVVNCFNVIKLFSNYLQKNIECKVEKKLHFRHPFFLTVSTLWFMMIHVSNPGIDRHYKNNPMELGLAIQQAILWVIPFLSADLETFHLNIRKQVEYNDESSMLKKSWSPEKLSSSGLGNDGIKSNWRHSSQCSVKDV